MDMFILILIAIYGTLQYIHPPCTTHQHKNGIKWNFGKIPYLLIKYLLPLGTNMLSEDNKDSHCGFGSPSRTKHTEN